MPTAREMQDMDARVTEQYLLTQYIGITESESYQAHKERVAAFKKLYRGEWIDLYPDGTDMPSVPLIENIAKTGIHDLSGLAAETRPAAKFVPKGDSEPAYLAAQVKEAISDTIWDANRGERLARRLYMDFIGSGFMVCAASMDTNPRHPYPTITRLKPDRCWPTVRSGFVQDMLYIEEVKVRELDHLYPGKIDLTGIESWADGTARILEFYTDVSVTRAVMFLAKGGKVSKKYSSQSVHIVDRWEHKLGMVPVAFEQLETYDDAFRGLYDQAAAPILTRNRIVQFMSDYIYDMVHASFEEKNVRNWETPPGPDTVYHHDPTADQSFIRRVQPAAPAGAVFGLAQMLEQATSGETIQPPSRQGTVTQSIASASFVGATQGKLTTVIKDMQDAMASMRQQLAYITFEIDKRWLDESKPLWRPVGKKNNYKPSTDIGDFIYCHFEFGAAAGIGKEASDARVLQHLGAKMISQETGREQLDYVTDPSSEQRKIDREDAVNSFKQRLLGDPRMPLAVIAKVIDLQENGSSMVEAAQAVLPELQQADQAMQAQAAPTPQGPSQESVTAPGPEAGGALDALIKGGTETKPANIPSVEFAPPPLQTQQVRNA